jgi:hypothetical protein
LGRRVITSSRTAFGPAPLAFPLVLQPVSTTSVVDAAPSQSVVGSVPPQ